MPRPHTKNPTQRRMLAALTVIRRQALGGHETALHFAVFERAARDAFSTNPKDDAEGAALYLEGPMPHLEYCGIDPIWAREVLLKAGLRFGSYNAQRGLKMGASSENRFVAKTRREAEEQERTRHLRECLRIVRTPRKEVASPPSPPFRADKKKVKRWASWNACDYDGPTQLAEAIACEFPVLADCLSSETHWVWDVAADCYD